MPDRKAKYEVTGVRTDIDGSQIIEFMHETGYENFVETMKEFEVPFLGQYVPLYSPPSLQRWAHQASKVEGFVVDSRKEKVDQ